MTIPESSALLATRSCRRRFETQIARESWLIALETQCVGHKIILIETASSRPLATRIKSLAEKNRRVILDQAGSQTRFFRHAIRRLLWRLPSPFLCLG